MAHLGQARDRWWRQPGGLVEVGHAGEGFAFDNELPRHRQWLEPYALMNRLVTHGEWWAFVQDGGVALSYRATVNETYDSGFYRLPNAVSHNCFDFDALRRTLRGVLSALRKGPRRD